MARKIVHQLIDDLDGEVLEVESGETVSFSLNGISYEIDLSEKNATALRAAFEPWVKAGRRVAASGGARSARGGRGRAAAGGRDLAAIRTWAKANGHQVADRGRVPESVLQAYAAAH